MHMQSVANYYLFHDRWVSHIVQSCVHGANVAVAHLHHEAALVQQASSSSHSGRPFVVTDPNPPISYGDLHLAVTSLARHRISIISLPPVLLLVISHLIEFYAELPHLLPSPFSVLVKKILPPLRGDVQHLKPGLFSITTHLVGSNAEISKPVSEGGLGYKGLMTTLEGIVQEVLEWNREHQDDDNEMVKTKKTYTSSISLAAQIQKLAAVGHHQVQLD